MFDTFKNSPADMQQDTSYQRIDIANVPYRKITQNEYSSLSSKYTSIARKIISGAGLAVILCLLFSVSSLYYAFFSDKGAESESAIIYLPLSVAIMSFSLINLWFRIKQLITPDSMVVSGKITDKKVRPGYRSTKFYTYTIALYGTNSFTEITNHQNINANETILLVSSVTKPFIVPVPEYVVDNSGISSEKELSQLSCPKSYDYSNYAKVSFNELTRYQLSYEDYMSLPKEMRSCSPMSRGGASVTWSISFFITAAIIAYFFHCRNTGKSFPAAALLFVLICSFGVTLYLIGAVFGKPLKKDMTSYADGVIISKSINMGRCFMTVIFPYSSQYVQSIETSKKYYEQFTVNENARFYFDDRKNNGFAVYMSRN